MRFACRAALSAGSVVLATAAPARAAEPGAGTVDGTQQVLALAAAALLTAALVAVVVHARRSPAAPTGGPASPLAAVAVRLLGARREAALLMLLALAAGLVLLPAGVLRALVVVVLVCALPGALLLDPLGVHGPLARPAAAVGLSLGLQTLAASTMLWLDVWHPEALAAAVWGGSAVVLLLRIGPPSRRTTQLPDGP